MSNAQVMDRREIGLVNNSADQSQYEKVDCHVFKTSRQIASYIANEIATLIRSRADEQANCVLGLATGSTPVGVYDELVRMHREEGLSFQNVITFNLDEYFPVQPNELQSYVRFMREHLFDHIDIQPENVNIPDGTLPVEDVDQYCADYEQEIIDAGGIDIQLLGIGRTGHIGFNEPGSGKNSRTRLITLDRVTRIDAASDFFGIEHVPRRAITMGVGTILDAKRIFLLAFGEHKAPIVARTVEGDVSPQIPATFLQGHPGVQFLVDEPSSESLTRTQSPWLTGTVDWNEDKVRKATIWLARKLDKAILKLTEEDFNENGLQDMLAAQGPAYDINVSVFRSMQRTITGWPGGKPADKKQPGDLSLRHDEIFPKRALIFSPHPDDDVISMGGTLIRLADQGHEVHVAYQTSGNIAVFDEDAIRFTEFVDEFCRSFGIDSPKITDLETHVDEFLRNKKAGQVDSREVQTIKGLIRRGEARCAARLCGVPNERLHFMEMPFYETGRVKKLPLGEEDVQLTVNLLRSIEPHLIYAAGDLSDPHGTHRTCLSAVIKAWQECESDDWRTNSEFWLYRGAWQEWDPDEIEMAVPLSPQEVERKRVAIFKHESQKDRALFPGPDKREFWKRAQDRNSETAALYDRLGLAEYEAIEGFVRWKESMDLC